MPRAAVIICSTPRSGSSLLSNALWETGLCGRPAEYFEQDIREDLAKQWDVHDHGAYVNRLVESTSTPNGVFGLKVHWHHMDTVRTFLQPPRRLWRRERANPFVGLAPELHFVFLNRRDKLGQAVSLYRAMSTRRWRHRTRDDRPYVPPPQEIDLNWLRSNVRSLERREGLWRTFFAQIGVAPLELSYEDDLEVSYQRAVLRVLDSAGIERPPDLAVHSDYQRQRDEWSEAVVQIYELFERRGMVPR